MKLQNTLALLASTTLALTPIAALAVPPPQVWDVVTGFNSAPWSYMQRAGAGCAGTATPLLYNYTGPSGTNFIGKQGVNTPAIVPLVAKNLATSGVTVYSTAQIPANSVWLHPGETGVNAKCATVRFVAPMAGKFRIQGFIKSVDTGANSVNGHILVNNVQVGPTIALSGPLGTQVGFDQTVTLLGQPRVIDFALDDGGSYYNDSTQLALTITRCPPSAVACP